MEREKKKDKDKDKKGSPAVSKTNGWDALIRFIDLINEQFKTGNFFGLVILFSFTILFYLAYKLPPENIDKYISVLAKFVASEKYYIFPFTITLSFSLVANVVQRRVYCNEINRHAELRKELIHGFKTEELKELTSHVSSNFNLTSDNS